MHTAMIILLACGAITRTQAFDYFVHPADATGPLVPYQPTAKPPKNQWVTNAVFHTRFARITDAATDGVGHSMASVVYSRWTPLNASQEYLYLQRSVGNPDGLIYSAGTDALIKILPERTSIDGVPDQSFNSMEGAEIRWDYTGQHPNRFYFVEGPRFYEYDLTTDTARLRHDFSVVGEFPSAELIYSGVEGDSSADSRYWAWQVEGAYEGNGAPLLAVVTYDSESNRLVGRLALQDYRSLGGRYNELPKPNMVEVSPSGRKVIYHLGRCWGNGRLASNWTQHAGSIYWTSVADVSEPVEFVEEQDTGRRYRSVETLPTAPGTSAHDRAAERLYVWCSDSAPPATHQIYWEYGNRPKDAGTVFDGPHAWNLDFTQPVKVSVDETHSGWAWSADGRELFVSQNNRNDWIEARDIETGTLLQCLHQGDFGWGNGWHFARMPKTTPGWILLSTYRSGTNTDWGDNQLLMLEMKDRTSHPRVWRLGPTHNQYDEYYAEGFAAMSQFGDRLWWGAKWPGQANIETYEMPLPSDWWRDPSGPGGLKLRCVRGTSPGEVELQWSSITNRSYRVITATNVDGTYEVLTNGVMARPPVNVLPVRVEHNQSRFYRVAEEP